MNTDKLDFEKLSGLLPAVVQDSATREVLMIGFMNRDAVEETLFNKKVTFWSRTKRRLWQKGETSGNFLEVVSIRSDCDNDALLIEAIPTGPVCHQGTVSCFGDPASLDASQVFRNLAHIIRQRHQHMPSGSYTADLFRSGTGQIAKKVGEEGVEVALSALEGDSTSLRKETADLLYHLMVLLEQKGLSLDEIAEELKGRFNGGK
ncbi:MAG: bifunctional phosphoribosyl-AMP cyclohydrolase/phosphoribosyl-ATP diphosphatase HisIE [Bacteroidota bacterium]